MVDSTIARQSSRRNAISTSGSYYDALRGKRTNEGDGDITSNDGKNVRQQHKTTSIELIHLWRWFHTLYAKWRPWL